jgi:hypothetical protein
MGKLRKMKTEGARQSPSSNLDVIGRKEQHVGKQNSIVIGNTERGESESG